MSVSRKPGWVKVYRRAQLETCGKRHGLAPRAMGSKHKTSKHSIDTIDARRQVRQEKRRQSKAARRYGNRTTRTEIAEATQ
jgi:hypothetical protein